MKISIGNDGTVTANYSNGERLKVSRIVLAKFANFGGLVKEGQNMFSATDAAGPPRVGMPGPELGSLFTNALEQSTVDLAAEFVKMITTQRGFQANSRVITTTDEMLGELINLKR
jgi:flagellar hook protein FlgE